MNEDVEKSIEIKSDELQEILTKPPHSIVRYGITIFCSVFLLLLIGSFVFCYPDIVEGTITVTAENPPVWSVAHTSERIKKLYVKNGDYVNRTEILAVLENTATTEDVIKLDSLLNLVVIHPKIIIPEAILLDSFNLGNVQAAYSDFLQKVVLYNNFTSLNLIEQEESSVKKQKAGKIAYISNLKEQLTLKKRHLEIAQQTYNREKYLFEKELISLADMELAESTLLEEKEAEQLLRTSISMENVELSQLQESSNKLSFQYAQEHNQLIQQLMSSYKELKVAISQWKQNYVLMAHDNGIVTFNTVWTENQFINAGDNVFAVIPDSMNNFVGKVKTPIARSGKVKKGQLVLVKSEAYPYLEYGYLQGSVNSISLIPDDNTYTVEVTFQKQLVFSSGKPVKFTGEIIGTAQIITEKRSIISRLIMPLYYLLNEHM